MNASGMPLATYVLLVVNIVASLVAFSQPAVFSALAFQVGPVMDGQYYRLLTSGFLHGGIAHLAFNMMTLFFFGPALEHKSGLGRSGFLSVYFIALLAGNFWALFAHIDDPYYAAVGASGAISGVMIGVSLIAPFSKIYLFGALPIPAILFAVGFIAYSATAPGWDQSNIGHEAHLGGAVAGLIVTIFLRPRVLPDLISKISALFSGRRR
jgi:membrane associated rhomboid family serine protease